eukprot:scaffold1973_cov399-Prasinococcus_capsulatus_cf.AAC.21
MMSRDPWPGLLKALQAWPEPLAFQMLDRVLDACAPASCATRRRRPPAGGRESKWQRDRGGPRRERVG